MTFQPDMAFRPDMAFWPELIFRPEMAFQPEIAFWLGMVVWLEMAFLLLSNEFALFLKALKGLARLYWLKAFRLVESGKCGNFIYRTRAIITRGLYTFYPLFEVHLCTVTFGLMYG
jgi:hypothetical protein